MKNLKPYLLSPIPYLLICFYILLLMVSPIEAEEPIEEGGAESKLNLILTSSPPLSGEQPCLLTSVVCDYEKPKRIIKGATITAYNTVSWQTDDSPCIGAGGNICGRNDAVACPRSISLGTRVVINGNTYVCLDRLALKYDSRFDISFDKDIEGAKRFGKQIMDVTILD